MLGNFHLLSRNMQLYFDDVDQCMTMKTGEGKDEWSKLPEPCSGPSSSQPIGIRDKIKSYPERRPTCSIELNRRLKKYNSTHFKQ